MPQALQVHVKIVDSRQINHTSQQPPSSSAFSSNGRRSHDDDDLYVPGSNRPGVYTISLVRDVGGNWVRDGTSTEGSSVSELPATRNGRPDAPRTNGTLGAARRNAWLGAGRTATVWLRGRSLDDDLAARAALSEIVRVLLLGRPNALVPEDRDGPTSRAIGDSMHGRGVVQERQGLLGSAASELSAVFSLVIADPREGLSACDLEPWLEVRKLTLLVGAHSHCVDRRDQGRD
jgi:hypothetical protein